MAVDKLVDSAQLDADLTLIANSIRAKGGTLAQLAFPQDFITAINAIPSGSGAISVVDTLDTAGGTIRTITAVDISDTTAVAADVASGKYFYTADGVKTAGTGSGGGGGISSATGTFTGTGTITAQISCSFAPDLIYVHADLSGSASLRGIVSITIIKDTEAIITTDASTSSTQEVLFAASHSITGYGSSDAPHATYSNGTLTLDMVINTSQLRFASGVTYSYTLLGWQQ